jgi:hypothetical protein
MGREHSLRLVNVSLTSMALNNAFRISGASCAQVIR